MAHHRIAFYNLCPFWIFNLATHKSLNFHQSCSCVQRQKNCAKAQYCYAVKTTVTADVIISHLMNFWMWQWLRVFWVNRLDRIPHVISDLVTRPSSFIMKTLHLYHPPLNIFCICPFFKETAQTKSQICHWPSCQPVYLCGFVSIQ